MTTVDLINGAFECLGGFFILPSIFRLARDKAVLGVSLIPVVFFSIWGFWNLFFYSHLGLALSFWGGVLLFSTNAVWTGQMVYYRWIAARPGPEPVELSISVSSLSARVDREAEDWHSQVQVDRSRRKC